MKKILGLLSCFLAASLIFTSPGMGQKKVYKVGILQNVRDLDQAVAGFKDGMKNLGYEEGVNIEYEYQIADAVSAKMTLFAEQFVAAKKDLIFACSTPVAKVLKEVTAKAGGQIPVVFTPVSDPVAAGLIAGRESSGNNLTGVASGVVTDRQLEILVDIVPKIKRVLVVSKRGDASSEAGLKQIVPAAEILGIQLIMKRPVDEAELTAIIRDTDFSTIDAVHIPPDTLVGRHIKPLYEACRKYKIPIIVYSPLLLEQGGFLSYVSDYYKLGQQVAGQADQILKGTLPSQIRVADPNEYYLGLNFDVAKEYGLVIPEKYLSQVCFSFSNNKLEQSSFNKSTGTDTEKK